MSNCQILNLEPDRYSPQAQAILEGFATVTNGPLTRAELLERLPEFDVLIVRLAHQIDREVISRGSHLKAIASATTGLNHIDLDFARQRGIEVLSLRGEVDFLRRIPATAEHTWGLLLALQRHIPQAYQSVLANEWERDRFRGHDLAGQTLGILGLGRIGEIIARYAQAFGMQVAAYDPYRTDWIPGVERTPNRSALLAKANILTIHVPLNASTVKLIGQAELDLLPQGASLINTSRGEVIDEAALVSSLESGHLAGAAVDVIDGERQPGWEHGPLIAYARTHANLLITPHIGGATVESMAATEIFIAQKIRQFLLQTSGARS